MTLKEAVRHAESRLRAGPHPDRAQLDAEMLLLHVIGKNRAWLLTHGDEQFGGCTAAHYGGLLERRHSGEPIQYITGEVEFYGLPFKVTPDVLIPRPETEHLVERAIELLRDSTAASVVDVGTGSGAIAIAVAHALPACSVIAIDISEEALTVARTNADINHVSVRFMRADMLDVSGLEPVSLVVSNPPYVAMTDANQLSVEVRDHEPHLALFAGDDGLSLYRKLIPQAFAALDADGHILLEIGYGQADAIRTLLESNGFREVTFIDDLQGIPRVVQAKRREA